MLMKKVMLTLLQIKMDKIEKPKKPDVFKTAATFIFTGQDWLNYRTQVMMAIKAERMALMSNGNTLKWIDEQIAKLPKEEKPKEPPGKAIG